MNPQDQTPRNTDDKNDVTPRRTRRRAAWITTAVLSAALVGLAGCSATASPAATTSPSASASASTPSAAAGHGMPAGGAGGSNVRSGPAAGGSSGTVDSVSSSGFTLTTSAGQKVTITEASSTTYLDGTSATTASAIAKGDSVLVLGTTNSTTIAATQVVVQPGGDGGSAASTAAGVVPFKRGAPSTAKSDGQIPANYTEGSGTIVSGTAANKATEAALAAYPGGVVDRVVQLAGGDYEVHYIGVNWPHHIFLSPDFSVLGAN